MATDRRDDPDVDDFIPYQNDDVVNVFFLLRQPES